MFQETLIMFTSHSWERNSLVDVFVGTRDARGIWTFRIELTMDASCYSNVGIL